MYKSILLVAPLAAALISPCSGATRIILGDGSAAASSTYSTDRAPQYAVDGAGLYGETHTNQPSGTMWMSQDQGSSSHTVSGQWFRVDLGKVVELDHFKLWNFNFWHATAGTTNRGIKEAEIYVSSLDTTPGTDFSDGSQWTRVFDKVTFAKASGLNTYSGEPDVAFTNVLGRWLALRVLSNFNMSDLSVGISELQVFAADRPVVLPRTPLVANANEAALSGVLTYDDSQSNTVFACWGTADGGTVSSAWQNVSALGYQPTGTVFSLSVPVLANSEYAVRFHAANAVTDSWSTLSSFITAPVTVDMPSSVQESAGFLTVTFRRPAALTNYDLTVTYTLSGTAVAGSDYTVPAITSSVIAAGSAAKQISFSLTDDVTIEPDKTFTVGLTSGPFVPDATGTNTTVIADDDGPINRYAWSHLMRVALPGYSGSSTLTNFPVPILLHEGLRGFHYADFAAPADGGDLRITDASTDLAVPFEIETWDSAGTSIVWASVSRLTGTSTALNLYWGNTNAGMPQYATNGLAWASGFGGVWHLQQPNAADSTTNRNNGMAVGNVTVPGLIGSGQFFDGSNDYITVADSPSIGTNVVNSLSVSLWFRSNTVLERTNEVWRLLEKGDDYFFCQGYGNMGGAVFLIKYTNIVYAAGNGTDIASNEWHHLCGTYDGGLLRCYLDGVLVGSRTFSFSIDDDKLPLRIGSDDSGHFFSGVLDETRVESTARSADWIKACYDSQRENSTFLTYCTAGTLFKGTVFFVN